MTRFENDKVLSELMTFLWALMVYHLSVLNQGYIFTILPAVINLASPKGAIEVDDWIYLHLLT
jgi:hypothetical protein